jgi:hypothetical protein
VWALSIALALLPCHAGIITLLALGCHPCHAGVVALIVLRHYHSRRYLPHCLRHSSGIVAFVPLASSFVLASLPLLHWHWHPHHAGIVALITLALLLLL